MAQTEILAAANTAARSAEVTVGSTPVTLSIFQAVGGTPTGGQIQRGVQVALERKIGSVWQPVYDNDGSAIYLSDKMMDVTIYGPGVYSLNRTINASIQIGAMKDEA